MFGITISAPRLQSPIFIVDELSDRAFNMGFRIINPEFPTAKWRIKEDTKRLYDFMDQIDESPYIGTRQPIRVIPPFKDNNRRKI